MQERSDLRFGAWLYDAAWKAARRLQAPRRARVCRLRAARAQALRFFLNSESKAEDCETQKGLQETIRRSPLICSMS